MGAQNISGRTVFYGRLRVISILASAAVLRTALELCACSGAQRAMPADASRRVCVCNEQKHTHTHSAAPV